MLKLITSSINATLTIFHGDRSIKFGWKMENGSYNGILGDVHSWRADMTANSLFMKQYGSDEFIFTIPLQQDCLCVVVPAPRLVPNWQMVFRAFEPEVWLWTGFAIASSMIFWWVLNSLTHCNLGLTDAVFYIGGIYISTVKLPRRAWKRVFTFSLLISSCVLIPTFQGSMLKLLQERSYEKEIKTLKEFKDSEYNIYTFSTNLVEDSLPKYLEGRVRLLGTVDVGTDLIEMVGKYRNLSYMGKKSDILQRINESRYKVSILSECPRMYFLIYAMIKGNLLYRAVNSAVSRIMASGLDQSPFIKILELKEAMKDIDNVTSKALDLSDVIIALYILKTGYSAAFVTFLGEYGISFIRYKVIPIFQKKLKKFNKRNWKYLN